jgi:pimeloyl-ACP methyl ester carboxylesterase
MGADDISEVPYGNNPDARNYVVLNGVNIYYEVYGSGEPLLLVHGNGGNIEGMKYQIEYFARQYKVIAMDCRGRGKSELGNEPLSYIRMAGDAAALLDHLRCVPAYFIGRSDGGIIGLILGYRFPGTLKKLAVFGANLWPGKTALYPGEVESCIKTRKQAEEMIAKGDKSKNWNLIYQRFKLMETQPDISADELRRIDTPVLVMSCDRDIIIEEHTLFIYRNIPNANLSIFPGETHWVTNDNPELFNSTVSRFFSEPFKGEEIRK